MLCWGRCLNGKMTVNKVIFWYGKYINVYVPPTFSLPTASEMDIWQSTESCYSLLSKGTISSWLHILENEEGRLIPLEICSLRQPETLTCSMNSDNWPLVSLPVRGRAMTQAFLRLFPLLKLHAIFYILNIWGLIISTAALPSLFVTWD